ncbi:er membrane protein complex subunit 2-like protein [Trifolium pratense]|uniref:Er membrane protein complex subunit 2-like protein n=1 Tax=Trifolium pratense TaxID=57577 RepID=A0A2K3LK64_TRIPR|nr:er membrane protein complex subunit 2-like protein [Trifolium pratense]
MSNATLTSPPKPPYISVFSEEESVIPGRLEAMLLEAKGSWDMAEKAYTSLLEDNPFKKAR